MSAARCLCFTLYLVCGGKVTNSGNLFFQKIHQVKSFVFFYLCNVLILRILTLGAEMHDVLNC